jgi:hypothetical protein
MTLMPVSNICSSVDCSDSGGDGRWIGQHAAERLRPHGDRDPLAEIDGRHPALHAVGRLHRDRAHAVLAQVLLDLEDDVDRRRALAARRHHVDRVIDRRQLPVLELDVDDRADDRDDPAGVLSRCLFHGVIWSGSGLRA